MIDLTTEQLKIVKDIIYNYYSQKTIKILVFGSRAKNTAKQYSDLDLLLISDKKIPQEIYYKMMDDFEESILPFRVDLLDWHRISSEFRKFIEDDNIEI